MKRKDDDKMDIEEIMEMMTDDPKLIKQVSKIIRSRKDRKLVVNLPLEMVTMLKQESKRTGLPMNAIVRRSISMYFQKQGKKKA